ncbi:MAG TPA: polysaccharide deacetylase family protein [Verrucomicrobiae bacterium]|nr:polysaccharide deacetylase family protein [Verrucomicrobiae bacterium]
MTRFHIAAIITAVLCGVELAGREFLAAGLTLLALAIVVGCGVAIPRLQLFGPFICRGSIAGKKVALTFDDGPDPASTPQLLELLRAEKVPATFFCIGRRVAENPALAGRIVREGHLMANHTFRHSHFTNFFTLARLAAELGETQAAIREATGTLPEYFRPPMGLSNPNIFKAAGRAGLKVIGWSIRSLDTIRSDPRQIVAGILPGLAPGAIILLHDGRIPAGRLVATVKSLLDELRKLGYEVVRLDELLK